MITERHNKASRQIIKALKKGHYGANICFTDIGSDAKLKEQGIDTADTDKWGERRKRRWKIGEAGHATHTQ